VADQPFAARLTGKLVIWAFQINTALTLVPGGFQQAALVEGQATVHVRRGTSGSDDVTLKFAPIATGCTYDRNGDAGPAAGPDPDFPPCSQDNDNDDGSNDDCTGIGGVPNPLDQCLPFVTSARSDDCDPGGACDAVDATGPGSTCELNGFCGTEDLVIQLEATTGAYIADSSGSILFGWDDQSTGATIQEGGPNDGTWVLPPLGFNQPVGPNGLRFLLDGDAAKPFAIECTMGAFYLDPDAVPSADPVSSPMPDHRLISFPILQR
jgi:hypothetical protein